MANGENGFKFTDEAVDNILQLLSAQRACLSLLKELISQGVDNVERELFLSVVNALVNVLGEYSDVTITIEEERTLPDASFWFARGPVEITVRKVAKIRKGDKEVKVVLEEWKEKIEIQPEQPGEDMGFVTWG